MPPRTVSRMPGYTGTRALANARIGLENERYDVSL
jgi:hypothetical protein